MGFQGANTGINSLNGILDELRISDTARSAAVAQVARALETEETRRYNEMFAQGTAAYVQHRYSEAAEAFEICTRLRPGDKGADVMLRRALRDLGSR